MKEAGKTNSLPKKILSLLSWSGLLILAGSATNTVCAAKGLRIERAGTEKAYFTHNGKPLLSFGGLSDFVFYAAEDAYDYKVWADWATEYDGEIILDRFEYPEGILSTEPGVIRLQKHAWVKDEKTSKINGCPIEFRNVFIKEIKSSEMEKS